LLNVVVIGGGFSGVEVAGAMAELVVRRVILPSGVSGPYMLQHGDRLIGIAGPSLKFACDKLRKPVLMCLTLARGKSPRQGCG
jgi:hypothetical protein